jgi:hypothetical protein
MAGNSVNQSKKEKQSPKAFAKGGRGRDNRMFGKQQAAPQRGGLAGKPDLRGPGAKSAQGGGRKMRPFTPATPAKAGRTAPAR